MSQPGTPRESSRQNTPATPSTPANPATEVDFAKYSATRAELITARARIQDLEAELADFSSVVMQEANHQVGNANREVALYAKKNDALSKQIDERDILIEGQKEQLDVLKQMISNMDIKETTEIEKTIKVDISNGEDLERALEFAIWRSPTEPTYRYDTWEYEQFLKFKVPVEDEQWFKKSLTSWKFASFTIEHEVEPLLNVSNAPHMSWLARRAFTGAVQDGTLDIEPISAEEFVWATRPSNPCCFCGKNSSQPQYARLHIIKIPRDQQTYPVGNECVIRVRFACEYLGFLRSIFSGLRKLETAESQKAAWKECMRLRQQMLWARCGGFWALPPSTETRNNYLTLENLEGDDDVEDAEDSLPVNNIDNSKNKKSPPTSLVSPSQSPKTAESGRPAEAAASSEKVGYPTHENATSNP